MGRAQKLDYKKQKKTIMRKSVIAMLIAFSFAVVSCGGTKEGESAAADSVEVVEVDTLAVPTEETLGGEGVSTTDEVAEPVSEQPVK
jgi:hypothetical protein